MAVAAGVAVAIIRMVGEPHDWWTRALTLTADLVDRRGHFRQQCRIAKTGAGNERSQFHAGGAGGEGGVDRPSFPHFEFGIWRKPNKQVIRDPNRIEANCLRALGNVDEI